MYLKIYEEMKPDEKILIDKIVDDTIEKRLEGKPEELKETAKAILKNSVLPNVMNSESIV